MNFKLDQLDGINSAFAARDPRPDCKLDYLSLSRSVPPPFPSPLPYPLATLLHSTRCFSPFICLLFSARHISDSPSVLEAKWHDSTK